MRSLLFFLLGITSSCTPGPVVFTSDDEDECEGCESDADSDSDTDTDSDSDADSDTDSDSDSDTDTDTDSDQDNDGYNAAPEIDCDDEDPDVHPGATEVCDGIDNDCDGAVDEGDVCDEDEDTLTVSVDHPSSYDRLIIDVQTLFDASKIGDEWNSTHTVYNDDDIAITITDDFDDLLGFLFNVPVDTDGDGDDDDWYCYGHYSTASLDSDVEVDIVLDGVAYDEDDLVTWSPASLSETSLGCAALLWFGSTSVITEGYVK